MKNIKTYLLISILTLIITACSHDKVSKNITEYPKDSETISIPFITDENRDGLNIPNCAADGPGCQQFNPNL